TLDVKMKCFVLLHLFAMSLSGISNILRNLVSRRRASRQGSVMRDIGPQGAPANHISHGEQKSLLPQDRQGLLRNDKDQGTRVVPRHAEQLDVAPKRVQQPVSFLSI